ncbi:hypothetical protein KI387_004161, partial [Taxus chinensis]
MAQDSGVICTVLKVSEGKERLFGRKVKASACVHQYAAAPRLLSSCARFFMRYYSKKNLLLHAASASTEVSNIIADISTLTSELVDEEDITFAVAGLSDEDSRVLSAVETILLSQNRGVVKAKENYLTFL